MRIGSPVDMMVAPIQKPFFLQVMQKYKIEFFAWIPNVAELVNKQTIVEDIDDSSTISSMYFSTYSDYSSKSLI